MADQALFTLYGTEGILYLPDPNGFGGEVRLQPNWAHDKDPAPARALECPRIASIFPRDNSRGLGPAEMAAAIRANRPCRASADMACHVLEVIDAQGVLMGGTE